MRVEHRTSESQGGAVVCVARFAGAPHLLSETHLCVVAPARGGFEAQLDAIEQAREDALLRYDLNSSSTLLRRVFLSDVANQAGPLARSPLGTVHSSAPMGLSVIEQPPVGGQKLAIWEYHVSGDGCAARRAIPGGVALEHAGRCHLWICGLTGAAQGTVRAQTMAALQRLEEELTRHGASLRDHAVRTWFYVEDIDTEYPALVEARRQRFSEVGLSAETHYIASTGIAGRGAKAEDRIHLDAYAIGNLSSRQVQYLSAPTKLGPTHVYGVTFERGTRIAYGDRCHLFISGTASIDPDGRTLHVGDVARQCERAMENVCALLEDGGARLSDLVCLFAYVRDPSDGAFVSEFLSTRCPGVPTVVVRAPVCRPTWLVEFECMAVTPEPNPEFAEF